MNARQAAKAAAKKIEELEHYNAMAKADIVAYNRVVTGLISGDLDPCEWCEENADCKRPIKGKGCSEWWLAFEHPVEEAKDDDSERVPLIGSTGGA